MDPKLIVARLFVAVPELHFDKKFVDAAYKAGYINKDVYINLVSGMKYAKKYKSFARKMSGKDVIQRLIVVANELLSATSINVLRRLDVIDAFQGNALKLALRAAKRGAEGKLDEVTIIQRLTRVFGVGFSSDMVSLIRTLDDDRIAKIRQEILDRTGRKILEHEDADAIRKLLEDSVARGELARGGIKAGRIITEALKDGRNAASIIQGLVVFSGHIFDEPFIRALIKARLVSPEQGNTLIMLVDLGMDAWRKVAKSFEYESWAARAMMVSQGFITPDMVYFAREMGWIDVRTARYLYPAVAAVREALRQGVENYAGLPGRKHRILPGRSPITTYANATKFTDRQLLKLLAEAADDAGKEAEKLMKKPGFGRLTRARQQRLVAAEMHEQMRILWEGVGHLTIFGEKQAAAAAVESMSGLQSSLFKDADAIRMLDEAGRAGVDSFISRQENLKELSSRVYGNWDLVRGKIDREVNKGLLRGQSAQELSKTISQYINPKAPGGVRYAAMRLARTEINNAFHQSAIRYTREMPWVRGYKWNLSGSHGKPDICNTYAERQSNMGRGVFKKGEVPSKPHPHCLCFITTVTDRFGDFERGLNSGKYDRYLNQVVKYGMPGEGGGINRESAVMWAALMISAQGGVLLGAYALGKSSDSIIKRL